jgi:putative tricarboxylic transport membrane protein
MAKESKPARPLIPLFFWVALSLFIMFMSYRLDLGGFREPGPGMMPFLIALTLFLVTAPLLVTSLLRAGNRDKTVKEEMGHQASFAKITLLVMCLVAYGLLLERLGYVIATFLLLAGLFRLTGNRRWVAILISSALIALGTYFAFNFCGLKLPMGILKLR